MTFQPPSNYLPTTLPPPEMAEMRKLEVTTRNTLGICGKLGCQLPFQPLPTTVPPSPHTPLEGFAPLGGLEAPFWAYPADLFLPSIRGVTHHAR